MERNEQRSGLEVGPNWEMMMLLFASMEQYDDDEEVGYGNGKEKDLQI